VTGAAGVASAGAGSGAGAAPDERRDGRLAQRITVRSEGIPISRVLHRLTEKTGVRLRATGRAGNERLVAFVPGAPLSEVMRSIADLHRLTWVREGSREQPWYTLMKLPTREREEQGLRDRALRELLDAFSRALQSPGSEVSGARRHRDWGPALPLALPLVAARSGELLREGHVSIRIDSLPAEERARMVRIAQPIVEQVHEATQQLIRQINERRRQEGGTVPSRAERTRLLHGSSAAPSPRK
jgi:hypothetical protein